MAPAGTGGHRTSSTRAASSDEHQLQTTNDTVNRFLGGRQRSWMTTAKPVKPTPRPPNRPPRESLPEPQAFRPNGQRPPQQQHSALSTHLLWPQLPAPSDLLSVGAPSASAPSASAVLPSPAPSDEPSPAAYNPSAGVGPNDFSRNNRPAPGATTTAAAAATYAPVTEAHFLPVDGAGATYTDAHYTDGDYTEPAARAPAPRDTAVADGTVNPPEADAGSRISSAFSPASPASFAPHGPPHPNAPSPIPMTAALPQAPHVDPEPPAKRRRVGRNMSAAFLQHLHAAEVIDNHVRTQGGEDALEISVERPRYQLLRDACFAGDLFFVALHQVFCAWSSSNRIVHNLCVEGFHDTNLIDNAFGLMGTILKSNNKLRSQHAAFFINFPGPLDEILQEHDVYASTIHQVLNFLVRLSQHWMVASHEHRRLGYPLLMDELLSTFGLLSKILQSIVFRASRRALGVMDGMVGAEMDELFRQDQMTHLDGNGNFVPRMTQDFHKDPTNRLLISRFQTLIAQTRTASQATLASQQQPQQTPQQQYQTQQQQYQQTIQHQHQQAPHQQYQQVHQQQHRQQPRPNVRQVGSQGVSAPPSHQSSPTTTYPGSVPTLPSTGQETHSPVNPYSPVVSNGNTFTTGGSFVPAQYQHPSTHVPTTTSGHASSPTHPYLPSNSPIQSPNASQGQPNQMRVTNTPNGGQFVQSPVNAPGYMQHLGRRASQQFVSVPSTRSPQMQTFNSVPTQRHGSGSPAQNSQNLLNTANQVPQTRTPGQASPVLPAEMAFQAPPQAQPGRNPISNSLTTAQSPANGMSMFGTPLSANIANGQASAGQQMRNQQRLANQQLLYQMSQMRQGIRQPPINRQAHQSSTNGSSMANLIRADNRIAQSQYPGDAYDRKSLEMSLHQAHLRSPRRLPRKLNEPTERYYQAVKRLALPATPIPQQQRLYSLQFYIPDTEHMSISRNKQVQGDSLPINFFWDGSIRMRLRTCLMRSSTTDVPENEWVLSETSWPEHIYMQLNTNVLTVKRKQHHAKDQPIEIGSFIRRGINELKISVPVPKDPALRAVEKNKTPFIAVEVIETLSQSSIYALSNLGTASMVPTEETRAKIQKRLGGSSDPGDDEIAMVVSDLSINLADPFSYTLWAIPVRGKDCTHLECFDLETWLETRPRKKSCICGAKKSSDCSRCPKEPSMIDKWKCPLCQADARPYSLRIDGYLSEVREQLLARNLQKVKEIKVSADGSWQPVIPDDDSDFDSDDDTRPNGTAAKRPGHQLTHQSSAVEVIYLDDD
ncbi:uncharacterized protein JN550_001771 [Neoarthrinium moseri]|uniref:uncharacterized protein n=1 Tax=Neoarthrinium moseri TaxID=1658444 RepID=UPI001FDBF317|nr:uncharacterized protein JN550_001771 [Neoarthrinium moseri]KAI1876275.1 hypothetical protein JN550_001771 [Neoarthrinium moseri]